MTSAHDDLIVTTEDCAAAGLCVTGSWTWFRLRGLNYRKFVAHGMSVRELRTFDDGMAQLAIEACIRRHTRSEG